MSASEFFQPGRTYTDSNGYRAPEITTYFHVEHVTRHPERGHLRAVGWSKSGAPGARWHGDFRDEGEADGWTELPKPLIPVLAEGKGTGTTGGEPTPAPRRTDAERLHWLLSVIISERGQWTVGRVKRLYGRYHEGHVLRSTIRRELALLHEAGELILHDGSDRRYYTLAPGGGR
ncbi:hypothetical protein [Streptomyces sp. NBC_01565]|uniref:hypothetical protein n=1 Tax=Streptomyces sp. NBC_01565 TaxID=2975881 RepID=UPI002259138B|nr:hypothetical protein [Streptomyces sp. NBC_01565]MCX4540460.1 hypothetical protein [Streptomyces sp. NBC_01565]